MRNYSAPSNPQQNQQNPNPKVSTTTTINRSLFTGLPTNSSDSSSSSVHSNVDHPYGLTSALTQKYPENIFNCFMCQDLSKDDRARVLPCFHSFCESCIEKLTDIDKETITCPNCAFSSTLAEILPDYTRLNNPSTMTENYMVALSSDAYAQYCTACKTSESMAVAKCFQCSTFLCHQCVCAHQIMNCFEGHRVICLLAFHFSRLVFEIKIHHRNLILSLRKQEFFDFLLSVFVLRSNQINSDCFLVRNVVPLLSVIHRCLRKFHFDLHRLRLSKSRIIK